MGVGLNAGLGALAQVVGQELDPNAQLRRISPVLALVKDMEQRQVVEQQMAQRAFQLKQQMEQAERAEADRKALEDFKAKKLAENRVLDAGEFGPPTRDASFLQGIAGLPANDFSNIYTRDVTIADRRADAARVAADEASRRRIEEKEAATPKPLTFDELVDFGVPQDFASVLALRSREQQLSALAQLKKPQEPDRGLTVDQKVKLDRLRRLDVRAQTLIPYLSGDSREGLMTKLKTAASAGNWNKPEVQSAISEELDKLFGAGAGAAFVAGVKKDRTGSGGRVKASTAATNVASIPFIPWGGGFKSITDLKPLTKKARDEYAAYRKAYGVEDLPPGSLPEGGVEGVREDGGEEKVTPEDRKLLKRLDVLLPSFLEAAGSPAPQGR